MQTTQLYQHVVTSEVATSFSYGLQHALKKCPVVPDRKQSIPTGAYATACKVFGLMAMLTNVVTLLYMLTHHCLVIDIPFESKK